ncbi:BTB domain protein [Rhizoctonia solani AG-3 Rhs1AP]|uniref:BTB domain protein n=2 Tax=Rhizoctonia solani AG-3 TaxID=1086053 RepID=A0A074RWL6_9AGAM|nr:BTB domain protein [Rhizoctonia solani AG-3 Rhs1AP]KEP51284.1 BTB domain protein [Rhizoctonia solani 123E]
MEYNKKYTVSIQGVDFILSKSQIEFDGPNYFTTCFLGDFRESVTRRVELSRDPDLFRIVLSYLCGYNVFPLNEKIIPPTMTSESALLNLRADAEFYQLEGLAQACEAFINPQEGQISPKNRYLILGSKWFVDDDEYREDLLGTVPSESDWSTYATKERLKQAPLNDMKTPGSVSGFEGLRVTAVMERVGARSITSYDPRRYRLFGWSMIAEHTEVQIQCTLLVVFEDLEMK